MARCACTMSMPAAATAPRGLRKTACAPPASAPFGRPGRRSVWLAPRASLEDGTVAGLGGEAVAFASGAALSFLLIPVEEGLLMKCLIGIIQKSSIS